MSKNIFPIVMIILWVSLGLSVARFFLVERQSYVCGYCGRPCKNQAEVQKCAIKCEQKVKNEKFNMPEGVVHYHTDGSPHYKGQVGHPEMENELQRSTHDNIL